MIDYNGLLPLAIFYLNFSLAFVGVEDYDCLAQFQLDQDIAKLQGKFMGAVMLDITGAYDSVNLNILTKILIDIGIHFKWKILIKNLFYHRTLQGYCNGIFIGTKYTNKRVPQGSILAPLLFNIYLSKIQGIFTVDIKWFGFADDLTFYTTGNNSVNILSILENNLIKVKNWLVTVYLDLSIPKTKLIVFNPNVPPGSVSINIDPEIIFNSSEVKLLGIFWDFKLNWKFHINYLIDKAKKVINVLKYISSHSWGAHPETLLCVYKSYVRPVLEYSSFLFHSCPHKLLSKLDILQNNCLRIISGCFRTTPINLLHHIIGINYLQHRREYLAKKFILKNYSIIDNPLFPKSMYINDLLQKQSNKKKSVSSLYNLWSNMQDLDYSRYKKLPTFLIPYPALFLSNYIIYNNVFSENPDNDILKILQKFPMHTPIYTDGSKNNDSCGYGIYIDSIVPIEIKIKINPVASIMIAEALAIAHALEISYKKEWQNIIIMSDSLSTLISLSTNGIDAHMHPVIALIRERLYNHIQYGGSCFIYWVPAHKGIKGNEKADKIAKLALDNNAVSTIKLSAHDYIQSFKKHMISQTSEKINNYTGPDNIIKGAAYFKQVKNFSLKPWYKNLHLTRQQITYINRIKSGHTQLLSHLFRMNIIDSPTCYCENSEQNIEHIIWDCPLIDEDIRLPFLTFLSKHSIDRNSLIQDIANSENPIIIMIKIVDFLTKNNIFI